MNAKEKAEEIFNQHYAILLDADSDISQEVLISVLAKKMALVTVKESIITASYGTNYALVLFLKEVKREIENL